MSRAESEKRILRLHKGGTGILKIGKAFGIGTGTVQRAYRWSSRALSTSTSLERRLPLCEAETAAAGEDPRFSTQAISQRLVAIRFSPPAITRDANPRL
jgi:hypothetical protein